MAVPAFVAGYLAGLEAAEEAAPGLTQHLLECWDSGLSTGMFTADEFLAAARTLFAENSELTLARMMEWQAEDTRKLQSRLTIHRKVAAKAAVEAALQPDMTAFASYEGGLDPSAGSWLLNMPKTQAQTISPDLFRQMLRTRLTIPHPDINPTRKPCVCGHTDPGVDSRGVHFTKCKTLNCLTISTHDAVKLTLGEFCKSQGMPTRAEVHDVLAATAPENNGVMDLVVDRVGKPNLVVDVTITSNVPIDTERGKRSFPKDRVIELAITRKNTKYRQACLDADLEFLPFVLTTQGNICPNGRKFMRTALAARHPGSVTQQAVLYTYWIRRLVTCMLQGVAKAQIARAVVNNRQNGWEGQAHTTAGPLPGATSDKCYREGTVDDSCYMRTGTFNLSGGGRPGDGIDRGGGAAQAAGSG